MNALQYVTLAELAAILAHADHERDVRESQRRPGRDFEVIDFASTTRGQIQAERKTFQALMALSDRALGEVAAIMWLGRGDFDDLEGGRKHFFLSDGKDAAALYIAGKSPLSRYLRAGLAKLQLPSAGAAA